MRFVKRTARISIALLAIGVLGLGSAFAAGLPANGPSANDLSQNVWRMPGSTDNVGARIVFPTSSDLRAMTQAQGSLPAWKTVAKTGDADTLRKTGMKMYETKVDYLADPSNPGQGDFVSGVDVAGYIGNYQYDVSSPGAFDTSKQNLISFAKGRRAHRVFSVGLPMFAWDVYNGLSASPKHVRGPLNLFTGQPSGTNENGAVDVNASVSGIYDAIRTNRSNFFASSGIQAAGKGKDGTPLYTFPGLTGKFGFKIFQDFLFQKTPQGNTVEKTNSNPERSKNGQTVTDGWSVPQVSYNMDPSVYDAITDATETAFIGDLANIRSSGLYAEVKNGTSDDPAGMQNVVLEDPSTWTVEYGVDPQTRFDPALELDSTSTQEQKASKTYYSAMQVIAYTKGLVVDDQGNTVATIGPYAFSQAVYVDGLLTYMPETLDQAKMALFPDSGAPVYTAPGSNGLRDYDTPEANVPVGDPVTNPNQPTRQYRGMPNLDVGETLAGADKNGQILQAQQVNADSQLCYNMAMTLATRYRYNPVEGYTPTAPPADMAQYNQWLDTNFPICISYYAPYKNQRGDVVGPYVRLAGPISGYTVDTSLYDDDRYGANKIIPGSDPQAGFGSLYKPIRFSGNLLKVVNLLALPAGHPARPTQDYAYGSGALPALGYPYAWRVDFDPTTSDLQKQNGETKPSEPVEVIRIPLKPPQLQFVSEVLPIHPGVLTEEQIDTDGTLHKASLDAHLINGWNDMPASERPFKPNTQQPDYGRNNYAYAVVGQCCGPVVLISQTISAGNRVATVDGKPQQVGARPNTVTVLSADQQQAGSNIQQEALGIPSGFDAGSPSAEFATGQPAVADYRVDSISSRAGSDYPFGSYSNVAPTLDATQPLGSAANPKDAQGRSFLTAQNNYEKGKRYFVDVCGDTAVTPQVVSTQNGNVVAYFVKDMALSIFAPSNSTVPDKAVSLYHVDNLAKPPSQPPCQRVEWVPREAGTYALVTTITDFNGISRTTKMTVDVKDTNIGVDAVGGEKEKK